MLTLLSMVALLFPMLIFMFASPPLLILKHDTPKDAGFIRGLFSTYYTAVLVVAAVGTLCHALAGRPAAALAMGGVAAFVFATRRWVLSRMDVLRGRIEAGDSAAIFRFRRLHIAGMLLNVVQLGAVAWGIVKFAAP